MSQVSIRHPVGELDLGDQLRLSHTVFHLSLINAHCVLFSAVA
jgi:hypothetical protein